MELASAGSRTWKIYKVECRWEGGSGTSLEQYIPSASTSQVVPEDKEAERASHTNTRNLEVIWMTSKWSSS